MPGLTQSHILSLETELRIIYPGSEDFLKIQFLCYDIIVPFCISFSRNRLYGKKFFRSLSYYNYRKYFVALNYIDCLDTLLDYTPDVRFGIIF